LIAGHKQSIQRIVPQNSPSLYVVIAVFNESANVDTLCKGLLELKAILGDVFRIQYIVVDDGSRDDTVSRFKSNNLGNSLMILNHDVNQGPGAAFGTAFSYLANRIDDADRILTMEGDNTSRLEIIQSMLDKVRCGAEVVLASPNAPGGEINNVVWYRLFLSHAANTLARWLLGLGGIYTLSSFFRLHTGGVMKRLQCQYGTSIIESSGFEWAVEMLAKLVRIKASIDEVPLRLDFSARKGPTKMRIIRTIVGYFRVFIRSRFW